MDSVEAGELEPRRIDTKENISDVNTKHLGPAAHAAYFNEVQGSMDDSETPIKIKIMQLLRLLKHARLQLTEPVLPRGGALLGV